MANHELNTYLFGDKMNDLFYVFRSKCVMRFLLDLCLYLYPTAKTTFYAHSRSVLTADFSTHKNKLEKFRH